MPRHDHDLPIHTRHERYWRPYRHLWRGGPTAASLATGGVIAASLGNLWFDSKKKKTMKRKGNYDGGSGPPNKKPKIAFPGFSTGYNNALSGRASMKRRGHKNVKSVQGKKRKVHVSKKLRDKISKVIESKKMYGQYITTRQATIGMIRSAASTNSYGTLTVGPYTSATMFTRCGKTTGLGSLRNWFAGGVHNETIAAGADWNFFSPLKVMDAASILWNNKAMAADYTLQTGNFLLPFNRSTGALITTATPAAPDSQGNKIHIINSWVKFELKNNSHRLLTVEIYNCVSKTKSPTETPLETFYNIAGNMEENGATGRAIRIAYPTDAVDYIINDPAIQPAIFPAFNASWKYEKMTLTIAPGETHTHYIKGPKNVTYDYDRMYIDGNDKTGYFNKHTMCVMMAVKPDMVYASAGAGAAGATGSGRFIYGNSAYDAKVLNPLSVEYSEVFKLSMPETAGFIQHAVTNGAAQGLNLRRDCYAFGNYTVDPDEASMVYVRADEESPSGAGSASGPIN